MKKVNTKILGEAATHYLLACRIAAQRAADPAEPIQAPLLGSERSWVERFGADLEIVERLLSSEEAEAASRGEAVEIRDGLRAWFAVADGGALSEAEAREDIIVGVDPGALAAEIALVCGVKVKGRVRGPALIALSFEEEPRTLAAGSTGAILCPAEVRARIGKVEAVTIPARAERIARALIAEAMAVFERSLQGLTDEAPLWEGAGASDKIKVSLPGPVGLEAEVREALRGHLERAGWRAPDGEGVPVDGGTWVVYPAGEEYVLMLDPRLAR